MKKKLGLQPRSKSECKEIYEDKGENSNSNNSSQKNKKHEKVKKRQATVPNSSTMKEHHTSRSLSSSFSCCQCQQPKPSSTGIVCRKS